MAWNTSCAIQINPSCTQEIKSTKLTKSPINVTSKQEMHQSAKIRNNLTSFTHIVMQIMPQISMIDVKSHTQFTSSMVPSYTGVSGKSMKPQEAVQTNKQTQCTQGCYIKTGSETSLDQLVIS